MHLSNHIQANKSIKLNILLYCLVLMACNSVPEKLTMMELDKVTDKTQQSPVFIKAKTENEIRAAYIEYIKYSTKEDKGRMLAISRLAEIEFELSNKILLENQNLEANNTNDELDEKLYTERLNKTIELLSTSLRDYKNSKNEDRILYQISKAYDLKGEHQQSIKHLQLLVTKYPESVYYLESVFRLAEEAFSRRDYIYAEDAYTEIIVSPNNNVYFEKALFKRGWSRYKQQLYIEALDDYIEVINHHEFENPEQLRQSKQTQFEEYFRALGLSFSHLYNIQNSTHALHEYLKEKPDFKYIYLTYSTVSDIFLNQERFSDAAAIMEQYKAHNPDSGNIPFAQLKIIKIWQGSRFIKKLNPAIEEFYNDFNPGKDYWKKTDTVPDNYRTIKASTKEYILLTSGYYHHKYQLNHHQEDFQNANLWYQRYLNHFHLHVRKDKVYFQYAKLLNEANKKEQALYYYELAAYDSELILNKEAAYASIVLSDLLYKQTPRKKPDNTLLNKHINYSILFSQMYPEDKRTENIILHAAELAFNSQQYAKSIELAEFINDMSSESNIRSANLLRAQAYFGNQQFPESEAVYTQLLNTDALNKPINSENPEKTQQKKKLKNNLALSIYKQAELAKQNNNIVTAKMHFSRISNLVPDSDIAATGLYDAIALAMVNNLWLEAINDIERFRRLYPTHKLNTDVSKKLSVAYLNSKQDIKAAKEFENISSLDKNQEIKQAALWQAALLYETKKDYLSAIRAYKKYAHNFKTPYAQHNEAMFKLTELYILNKDTQKANFWKLRILKADKFATKKDKTDRTRFIAANISLNLAKDAHQQFDSYRLVKPLKKNLKHKKNAMQNSVKFYSQASSYGLYETTTEATYAIANIYNSFSQALLNSEIPENLNEEEREQYTFLIEDQAFPFEEKAIEFFEINLARTRQGNQNRWITDSYSSLQQLYPARYKREPKIEFQSSLLPKLSNTIN